MVTPETVPVPTVVAAVVITSPPHCAAEPPYTCCCWTSHAGTAEGTVTTICESSQLLIAVTGTPPMATDPDVAPKPKCRRIVFWLYGCIVPKGAAQEWLGP